MKVLVVVDMQNDFIDGALANPDAQKIIEPMAKFIREWDGKVIFTRDTHDKSEYLQTQEGKKLPILHCVRDTTGWDIADKLTEAAFSTHHRFDIDVVNKYYFCGGKVLTSAINQIVDGSPIQEIRFCGTCTDICVVSNVLYTKTVFPETPIIVDASLCAGVTKEKHAAALEVMRSCQIEVVE